MTCINWKNCQKCGWHLFPENTICPNCHSLFDKPKTKEPTVLTVAETSPCPECGIVWALDPTNPVPNDFTMIVPGQTMPDKRCEICGVGPATGMDLDSLTAGELTPDQFRKIATSLPEAAVRDLLEKFWMAAVDSMKLVKRIEEAREQLVEIQAVVTTEAAKAEAQHGKSYAVAERSFANGYAAAVSDFTDAFDEKDQP